MQELQIDASTRLRQATMDAPQGTRDGTGPDSPPHTIRLLLVDSQVLVRTGLRSFLETQPGLQVVGEAGNAIEAITLAAQVHPNVILLEPGTADSSMLELVPHLLAAADKARVLLVTSIADTAFFSKAARMGVMGAVLKHQAGEVLVKAIHKVWEGEAWFTRTTFGRIVEELGRSKHEPEPSPEAPRIAALSQREREIIALLGEGLKNTQIADRLMISEVTVRHHIASILQKLCLSDRLDLMVYAYRNGLAELPR